MTKKQKKMLIRILTAFVLFAVLMVCEHAELITVRRADGSGWPRI